MQFTAGWLPSVPFGDSRGGVSAAKLSPPRAGPAAAPDTALLATMHRSPSSATERCGCWALLPVRQPSVACCVNLCDTRVPDPFRLRFPAQAVSLPTRVIHRPKFSAHVQAENRGGGERRRGGTLQRAGGPVGGGAEAAAQGRRGHLWRAVSRRGALPTAPPSLGARRGWIAIAALPSYASSTAPLNARCWDLSDVLSVFWCVHAPDSSDAAV